MQKKTSIPYLIINTRSRELLKIKLKDLKRYNISLIALLGI